jgi:putative tricarboxylic transport membrane protein
VKKYPLYITLVWAGLGLFVSIYAYKMGLGKLSVPGAGFMPFWLGIIIACLAFYKLITEFLMHADGKQAKEEDISPGAEKSTGLLKLAFIAIVLFAYAFVLEPLGYIITTFLALILLLRFAGFTRWILIVVYSAIIVGVSYFMFHYLGVMLPPGVFGI